MPRTRQRVVLQDPGGRGCQAFVEGLDDAQLDDAGVAGCPLAQPMYRDPCEQLNDAQGLARCG